MEPTSTRRAPELELAALRRLCIAILALPFTGVAAGVLLTAALVIPPLADLAGSLLPELLTGTGLLLVLLAPVARRLLERRARHRPAAAWRRFVSGVLLGIGLRGTAVLVGLAITLLTGDPLWSLALALVAAIAIVLDWPTATRYQDWVGSSGQGGPPVASR